MTDNDITSIAKFTKSALARITALGAALGTAREWRASVKALQIVASKKGNGGKTMTKYVLPPEVRQTLKMLADVIGQMGVDRVTFSSPCPVCLGRDKHVDCQLEKALKHTEELLK